MPRQRNRKSRRKSPMRGWSKSSPRSINPRRKLYSRCGSRCFLDYPKYPICDKNSRSCSPDCRGLLAALVRAKQRNCSPNIARRARAIAKRSRCKWI